MFTNLEMELVYVNLHIYIEKFSSNWIVYLTSSSEPKMNNKEPNLNIKNGTESCGIKWTHLHKSERKNKNFAHSLSKSIPFFPRVIEQHQSFSLYTQTSFE